MKNIYINLRYYMGVAVVSAGALAAGVLIGAGVDGCAALGAGATPVRVEAVHDGDTATVRFADGHREHVRLLGIDAPELAQAPWGRGSRDYLAGLVLSKDVSLETEPTRPDPYGRTLGYLRLADGMTANEMSLEVGWAFYYDPGRPLRLTPTLKAAEAAARDQHLGVWADDGPQRPWIWRHLRRNRVARASPQSRPGFR